MNPSSTAKSLTNDSEQKEENKNDIIEKYKDLNVKCDIILEKIIKRKNKNK